jgi:glycosyltransferase involved in cell wall biosynthesis
MGSVNRPLSVAFLTWRDQGHPDGGGSEVFVESVARELVARGHRVQVRCARYPGSAAHEVADGVELVRRGGRLTVYPRAFLWTLTRGRRVDVVVDVINGLPFLSRLARRTGLVALVHHVHREQWHIIYPGWRGRLGWWIESRLTPRVYRDVTHLTVSESSRRDLAALGIDPALVHVAHNGLDDRPRVAGSHEPARLCVLARLVPHKQIDHAFRVVRALREQHDGLVLDVIGEGWWHDELVREAADLGVADRVVFHGRVSADRRDELLAGSAVMLLPSVKEGWGLAVMEAAAQGTPTIAYRSAGGVRESVVDGVTGILVDDLDGLVAATAELLADAEGRQRMSERARERALEFSWSATATAVERVLEAEAVSRRR